MPTTPLISSATQERLALLGERLRAVRKRQRVSAVAAAEAAGISRVTLHRIERDEPTVAMGAWMAAASVLGLAFDLPHANATDEPIALPTTIRLADYPQLKKLAWQLHGVDELSPREALALYERNWEGEAALVALLSRELGGGRLLV